MNPAKSTESNPAESTGLVYIDAVLVSFRVSIGGTRKGRDVQSILSAS